MAPRTHPPDLAAMKHWYLLAAVLLATVAAQAQAPLLDTSPIREPSAGSSSGWSLLPGTNLTMQQEADLLHLNLSPGSAPSSATAAFPLDVSGDFSVEAQLRVRAGCGLRLGTGDDLLLLLLSVPDAGVATARVFRYRNGWTTVASPDWPTGAALPTAEHQLQLARRAGHLHCELDGQVLYDAPYADWPGQTALAGFFLEGAGGELWARQLTLVPRRPIRLAPGVPAGLRRERLPEAINSPLNERVSIVSADGRWLYFSRGMNAQTTGPIDENMDVLVAERRADGTWGTTQHPGPPLNNSSNNSVEALTPDGQNLLIRGLYGPTGNYLGRGLSLSRHLPDNSWASPTTFFTGDYVPDAGDYSDTSLDASGRFLVVSCDTKLTPHKSDLYVLERRADGTWLPARSLGPTLNTSEDEQAPFLAPDGKTLYFTSDGHAGYGGQDVFVTRRLDDSWTQWSEPLNLGPGINTPGYDGHFSVPASGAYGYLSGFAPDHSGKTDLYQVQLPPSLRPQPTLLVRGRVLDARTHLPVAAATVRYEQLPQGRDAGQVPLAADASYQLVLPTGQEYGFRASAPGYVSVNENVNLRTASAYGEQTVTLYLLPLADPTLAELEAMRKTSPNGTSIYDALTLPRPSAPKPNSVLASLTLEPARPAPVAVAAAPGAASVALAPPAVVGPAVIEEKIVLRNVFFFKGEPTLLPGSFPELQRLAQTLQDNPKLEIRLDGHTDNTGDNISPKPNQVLSEQRVAAVKKYLVTQGVAASRLSTRGYGGSRPVAKNDTEANKAQNRRVEFVVLRR